MPNSLRTRSHLDTHLVKPHRTYQIVIIFMSKLLSSVFDTLTMTKYFRLECKKVPNFRFEKYFRVEVPEEVEEFDEYFRVEVSDSGEIQETIGLELVDIELDEVVGMELIQQPDSVEFEEVVGLEISYEEDWDDLSDFCK